MHKAFPCREGEWRESFSHDVTQLVSEYRKSEIYIMKCCANRMQNRTCSNYAEVKPAMGEAKYCTVYR